MTKTVGGALRSHVLGSLTARGFDLGARCWRDGAPDNATFPYLTFLDPISDVAALAGDQRVLARTTQVSFDLWQRHKDEDDDLLIALQDSLDGQRLDPLDVAGGVMVRATFTTRLRSTARVPDPDRSVVHHALTVAVAHRSSH